MCAFVPLSYVRWLDFLLHYPPLPALLLSLFRVYLQATVSLNPFDTLQVLIDEKYWIGAVQSMRNYVGQVPTSFHSISLPSFAPFAALHGTASLASLLV